MARKRSGASAKPQNQQIAKLTTTNQPQLELPEGYTPKTRNNSRNKNRAKKNNMVGFPDTELASSC